MGCRDRECVCALYKTNKSSCNFIHIPKLNVINMAHHGTIIKFITQKLLLWYTNETKKMYYYRLKKRNHYSHILNKWRIIRQIDDQTIDFQLIQWQAIVCTMNIRECVVCIYACRFWCRCMLWCDIPSVFSNVITKLWWCCGFVVELLAVLFWFRSDQSLFCVFAVCVLFVWRWYTYETHHKCTTVNLKYYMFLVPCQCNY